MVKTCPLVVLAVLCLFSSVAVDAGLIEMRDAGMRGLGEFINVEPHYEVRVVSVRGKLPCPFGDPGIFPKTNTVVRNTELGREVTLSLIHI